MIDLTHCLNSNITVYPGTKPPIIETESTIDKNGYAELKIHTRSHAGTHIDAPCHIIPDGKSLNDFPIEQFIGPAIVIDCSDKNTITLDFLKSKKKEIEQSDFVLFYTGWQNKWNTSEYLDNFPTPSVEATEWLVNFNLKAVGFDHISADKMNCEELPNHNLLLKNEILIIENLTNLDKLIDKHFELNCIPLKFENADGSPVRAFARNIKS